MSPTATAFSLPTTGRAFSNLPPTAPSHFRLHLYATIYRVTHYLRTLDATTPRTDADPLQHTFDRYPFLSHYFSEIVRVMPDGLVGDERLRWWDREVAAWEAAFDAPLPLRALVASGVPRYSRTAFLLAGLAEEDARFGSFFADLQAPLPHRRPCLEFVGRIAAVGYGDLDPWDVCRPLVEGGFVVPEDPHAPRAEWTLRVPTVLWDTVRDPGSSPDPRLRRHEATAFALLDALPLPPRFLRQAAHLPDLLRSGKAQTVIVRGRPGSDRRSVLGAVARSLGLGVVEAEGKSTADLPLGALCTLTSALPVLTFEPAPGETATVPALRGYRGPVGVLLGLEGAVQGPGVEQAVTLTLPPLGCGERRRCWQQALGEHAGPELDEIAARFLLPGAYIRQAAPVAVAQAALDGRADVQLRDARAACRTLGRQHLDALAESIEATGTWSHLVIHPEGRAKLEELERRCRHRESLLGHLGPAFDTATRGVRVLFSGPSGTGKTLAARLLAAELGMDLYRLDLAAVINKYIGETEKNLNRILATAEALDVVLLIDEGDALLGNRTDVKSANDRYANLETNYLLQRLEHYDGIVVVTTNLGENIDRAFQRRMDVTVDFLPPQADERLRIWHLHLPDHHAIPAAFVERVAARCHLTGGQIRNAALHATLLAVEEQAAVGRPHLERALRSEYRKAGATCPLFRDPSPATLTSNVDTFLSALSP